MGQPASGAERQFWIAEQLAPGALANVAYELIRLDGTLDLAALDEALRVIARRHEGLRTGFVTRASQLYREVRTVVPPATQQLAPGTSLIEAARRLTASPFDLASGELIRMAVVPDAEGALLHLAVHHIAYDGLSHEILTADLSHIYGNLLTGEAVTLPVRPRVSASVVAPERRSTQQQYWRETLASVPDLPATGAGPTQSDLAETRLHERRFTCDPATTAALREAAKRQNSTMGGIMLTGFGQALAAVSGADDFCVGVPVAIRHGDRANEVGCELNVLPIRMRQPHTANAAGRVWRSIIGAMAHSDLSLSEIVAATRTTRSQRMPLTQALLAYQNWKRPTHEVGPMAMRTVPSRPLGGQVEIQAQVSENDDGSVDALVQAAESSSWSKLLDDLTATFERRLHTFKDD